MGWLDSILGFFGFNLNHNNQNLQAPIKNLDADDYICSVPAAKRFKHNHFPSIGNSFIQNFYTGDENMSPKQYFTSRRKVPAPRKPPVVQINETDDDEDEIQVISETKGTITRPNGSAHVSRDTSPLSSRENSFRSATSPPSPRGSSGHNSSSSSQDNHKNHNDDDEIQVIASDDDDDVQIEKVLPVSPCSSRAYVKTNVYTIDDADRGTDKENDENRIIHSKSIAKKTAMDSLFPRWSMVNRDIPRQRESSFLFKKKNPHERPSTLQQIQRLQSREDYARLIHAISSVNSNSTRENTIAVSSTRGSPTPTGSEVDALERLASAPWGRLNNQPGRHVSVNAGSKSSYVDVVRRTNGAANGFRFLDPSPQSLQSRIPVSKMTFPSHNTEDKVDAMIRRIQSIDLHRFDANIARSGLALDKTNEKVRSLEIPSYNVLLEKTISLRKVPEKLQVKKEEPKLLEITKEMEFSLRSFKAGARPDQVVSKVGLEEITKDQLLSLDGLTWLKDNVINCYMALLMKRSMAKAGELPNVYGFNTFFHTALADHGYSRVKRWTKKVDLFSYDILFVPIHVQKIHWCLATIDFRKKCVTYYDSMAGGDRGVNQRLLKYLADESMDKKKVPFDTSSWSTQCPKDIPQQENSCDCGVFTSTFAEYLARNANIHHVKQENMPYYRKKMMLEILCKQLLT